MPDLRRSTRASTVEATKRLQDPVLKKAKTSAANKKTEKPETSVQTESSNEKQPKTEDPAESEKIPEDKSENPVELEVGDDIPDFTLFDENEDEVSLKETARKAKFLVIFAYPKASTPGCTKQAAGFQKNLADLQALGTSVYGLSTDSPRAQLSFATKQGLKYPLLSDPSRQLISILGAKKAPSGVKRSHWIFVDGRLTVKKIQISPDVSVESALKDVQKLQEESGESKAETNGDGVKAENRTGENGQSNK